jgi:solute:Na+ symporter, SSS family
MTEKKRDFANDCWFYFIFTKNLTIHYIMQTGLQSLDYIIFLIYFIIVAGYGYWIYKREKKETTSSADFFLAEGSLTWWAIGASLIASNISAEQFIGMSGSSFALGLAIACYEWMASISLILIAVFFLPIYLKNKIFTMPQFLSQRYNGTVAIIMAVLWLFLYIFVNLSSILYLGALAINTLSGINFMACIVGLAVFAIFITLGGMKVIGYTDVIQVAVLIAGGLMTTYLALDLVADKFNLDGALAGLGLLNEQADDHFRMIINQGQLMIPDGQGGMKDAYFDLPGLSVLIGGLWIANLYYWGCNQYITQRALGASLPTARSGLLFAAFLKLLMPIIVVLPGIAAYVLHKNGEFQQEMLNQSGHIRPDNAYPVLLNLLPTGLKGLSFAALVAAIVASLAGKANSIGTIFSLDIYKKKFNKDATEDDLVNKGKIMIVISLVVAIFLAPQLRVLDQAFQFIQKYTGYLSPGIFAVFIVGFFWKKATSNAALAAALLSIPVSIFFDTMCPDIPFMNATGYNFLILVGTMIVISLFDKKGQAENKGLEIDASMFKVSSGFAIGSAIVSCIIAALYIIFW